MVLLRNGTADGWDSSGRREPAVQIVGVVATEQEPDAVRPRQCGRCRQLFEGDPTLHPVAIPDWWACPPCRAVLFGPDRTGVSLAAEART